MGGDFGQVGLRLHNDLGLNQRTPARRGTEGSRRELADRSWKKKKEGPKKRAATKSPKRKRTRGEKITPSRFNKNGTQTI